MNTIGINKIVDLNKLLKEENVKVHLRDACGKQSLWIENFSEKEISGKAYEIINMFFENEKLALIFSDDKINFWIN